MLMFSEFPGRRLDLLRFLFRRMRRKPLTWPRDAPDPGEIITSGWRVLLAASLSAVLLFFRHEEAQVTNSEPVCNADIQINTPICAWSGCILIVKGKIIVDLHPHLEKCTTRVHRNLPDGCGHCKVCPLLRI